MTTDLSEGFSSELILLGASEPEFLAQEAERLVRFLEQVPGVNLRDVAYTCARTWGVDRRCVLALVVHSTTELRARLLSSASRVRSGAERIKDKSGTYYFQAHLLGNWGTGRLAFIFPGAASFYSDMLRDLTVHFRSCRLPFDELEGALAQSGLFQPSTFIFPPAPYYQHDADVFASGAYAEAVVSTYSANAALLRFLDAVGLVPDGAMGFSGGDLNALQCGGYFGTKFDRAHRLAFLRDMYHVVNQAVSHAGLPRCALVMVIATHLEEVDRALEAFPSNKIYRAYVFSNQYYLVISLDLAEDVMRALAQAHIRCLTMNVNRPFNTPLFEKALGLFQKFSAHWVVASPSIPVYSCATTKPLSSRARKARSEAASAWGESVRFSDTIRTMFDDGFRVFVEVGPRGVLTNFIDDILRGQTYAAVATDSTHRTGLLQLQQALGLLAALGAPIQASALFEHRRARLLDFDTPLSLEVRTETELRLTRAFPHLALLSGTQELAPAMEDTDDIAWGHARRRENARTSATARARHLRQLGTGVREPLISDAEIISDEPGLREIVKTWTFTQAPFLADFALGSSHLSFADPKLRALVPLHLVTAAEMMAELAQSLMPNRRVVAIEDLQNRRRVVFRHGRVRLFLRAERTPSKKMDEVAVRVQLREDTPDSAWTWPAYEGIFILSEKPDEPVPFTPPELSRPRDVHWTATDIYPERLFASGRLCAIQSAHRWSETGLDYQVQTPLRKAAVAFTQFPVWALDPQLFAALTDGFQLWRSHARYPGAFSFPFRLRHLVVHAMPHEEQLLTCYLRNTGVTPRSLITDILVSDGNGQLYFELLGYEEITERVPESYRHLLLAPALAFLSQSIPNEYLSPPDTPFASAMITDVPYALLARDEELWLKTLSAIILQKTERSDFIDLPGSTARRTEWLFGRLVAKEAVRRFLQENYHARWCDADVQIWRDDNGKPHPIGNWIDYLKGKIDLSIAHTSQFVVALVAAHARVGLDVEAQDRELSEEFARGVFTPEEIDQAVRAVNAPSAIVRFWCAKEAVSKALGTGIRYSPRELQVDFFQAETGDIQMRLTGAWLENFKQFSGRTITVATRVIRGHVLASCFIPESFFARD